MHARAAYSWGQWALGVLMNDKKIKKNGGVCVSGGHWQSSSFCCAPLNTPSGTFPSVEWGLNYRSNRLRLTAFIRRPGEEVSVITAHPFFSSGGPFGAVRYTELTVSLIPHLNGRQPAECGPLPALDNPAQPPKRLVCLPGWFSNNTAFKYIAQEVQAITAVGS